ncbi:MAG TPA: cytochrome c3 family protein, partial [Bacillota bacterium]|nr:cytochrome c3 family protein [Bacillota bacterium]
MKARLIYLVLGIALAVAAVLGFGVFGAEATVVDVLYGKGDFEGQNYSDWSFVNISNTTGFQDSAYTSSGTGSAGLSVSGGEAAGYSYYSIPFTMPDGDSLITATVTGSFLKRTKDSSNAQKWIVSWEVYNSTGSSKISGGTIDTFIGDVAWKSFSHAITGLKFRERYVLRLSTRCVNSVGLNLQSYTNWDDIRLVVESELDSTAPTTAMSSPVPDSTVAGTVYLKATAADTGGSGVNRVDFEYADNSSFTGAVLLSGAVFQEGKWVMPWQTSAFNGTFWIRSRAHDGRGNYSYSTAVKYTLDNTPPTLSLSYFSDSAFSRPLKMSGGKLSAGTGDIYIRLDANEALRKLVEDNQISIDAPGTANDVTWPANFSWTGSAWCYKWHVVQDTDGDTLSIRVKGTDLLGNVRTLTSPESGGVVRLDTTPPICKLEYYSDPDLKQVLVTRDNIPVTRAGTVYVKLVPNETLRNQIGDNKLYIDAPGVVNDVKGGGFSWTGTAWRYTWNVNRGNSGLTASIRVQGTDVLGNVVSGIPAEGQQLRVDNIGPEVKLEYYSDPGLSPDSRLPLLNGQFFTASGSVWVKLISNKELKDGPGDNSVTIDAPGTDNDVNDGEFVRLGSDFVYRWDIRDSLDDKHSNDGQVQGVHIKATDYLGNITEYSPETDRVTIVNKGPEIKLHYFTDPGCTNPVPRTSDGRPILRAGLNYIRLDSNQPLTAIATDLLISIDAPKGVSNGNDVQDQPFTWVEDGKFWRYTYQVPAQGMDSNGPAEVAVQAVNWVGLGSTGKPLEGSLAEIYTTSAPATMTITGNKTYLASDNSASLSITVHLDNENGTHTGCEGRPVILASNFGEVSPSTALSDPDGNAIFTFRTAVGGTAKFSATVAGFPQLKGSFQVLCGPADYDPPVLIKAEAAGKQLVYLTFNEPLKSLETSNFILKQGSDTVSTMAYLVGDGRVVRLMVLDGVSLGTGNQFPAPLTYTVTAENVPDLADNKTDSSVISFESYTPHGKYAPQTFTSGNSTRMCGQCHSAHESTGARLLNRTTITKVCFVCHGILGVSEYRVEGEFTSRYGDGSLLSATLHKSLDGGYPGFEVMYCTDCHNPHGDRIPGQGNTIYPKLLKATVNGVVYNQGNDFCLACHGAVDKGFAGDPGYFSALGGNHAQVSAVHYNLEIAPDPLGQGALSPLSGTRVTCVRCHERHGSQFGKLLDNSRTGPEEDQCY